MRLQSPFNPNAVEINMSKSIEITENEDGTATIYCKPDFVKYEFDSFDDAVDALPNLDEV
jgi:hypothetical protein